jgi:hypothetical protein
LPVLPPEPARVDALLDDPVFFVPFAVFFEAGGVKLSGLVLGEFEQDSLEAGDVPAFPVPAHDHPFRGHCSVRHGRRFAGTFHEARRTVDTLQQSGYAAKTGCGFALQSATSRN